MNFQQVMWYSYLQYDVLGPVAELQGWIANVRFTRRPGLTYIRHKYDTQWKEYSRGFPAHN